MNPICEDGGIALSGNPAWNKLNNLGIDDYLGNEARDDYLYNEEGRTHSYQCKRNRSYQKKMARDKTLRKLWLVINL